jgi:hypothetical protein
VYEQGFNETSDAWIFPVLFTFSTVLDLFQHLSLSIFDTMAVIIVLLAEIMVEIEHIVHMERGASDDKHAYMVPESIRVLRIFLVVLDFRRKSMVHERANLMEGYARPLFLE